MNRLHLPTFRHMLEDLGRPSASVVARALGVHRSTVERWSRRNDAPRPALLCLFWLTSWGQSELDCDLANRAHTYGAHIAAVRRENDALRRELARVLSAADFGSANAPSWRETALELLERPHRAISAHR
ncbi:hypothetical protein [Roseateles sp.]|uniref:hypothetical protein n=1 Tax=Roseateles sp. TaxID=1971397 RepID=UPI002DF9E6B4|nr:hypothetical protein [Roseateles sp.]